MRIKIERENTALYRHVEIYICMYEDALCAQ